MQRMRMVTVGGFTVLITLSVLAACVGDDPAPADGTVDASSSGTSSSGTSGPGSSGTSGTNGTSGTPGTSGSPPTGPDADTEAGGPGDADADAPDTYVPPPNFCQSPAAAGAVFCVDFETSPDVTNGWDAPEIAGGATITRNTTFGAQGSSSSATFKLSAASVSSQGTLSKSITFTSKQKVDIDYDAYFVFPTTWSATTWNNFVTGVTRTGGASQQWYFDLERQNVGANPEWIATEQSGPSAGSALSSAITPSVWHHITHTYDATQGGSIVKISVDSVLVVSVSLVKGAAPNQAPSTFDQIFVNAGIENYGTSGTATELTIDNVMVHVF